MRKLIYALLIIIACVMPAYAFSPSTTIAPSSISLTDLGDVTAPSSVANDTLEYSGSAWVNSPVIAGEIELHNHTGITIATSTGIKNITGVTDGDASGSVVVSGTNGTITMPTMITSLYSVCFSLSFKGTNGDEFHGHVTVDGVDDNTGFEREMSTTKIGVVANCGLISLSSGQVLMFELEEAGDTDDATLYYFKLMVTKPR